MAPDDNSGAKPAPVALRIKLRYEDVDTLIQRFAPNVGKSGLFLPTKSLQPVGAEVKFELRLADDKVVITGLGRVKNAKAPDPAALFDSQTAPQSLFASFFLTSAALTM